MHFLLWELSISFYIFHGHRVCLVEHVDLICKAADFNLYRLNLYSWWEGFRSSSLATLPLGFNSVLFLPLHVGHLMGFTPDAVLEDLGLPL